MAIDIGVDEVTPEMIQLWRRLNEILDQDAHRVWEEDGGRQREFSDTCVELRRRLGLKPWEADPLAAANPEPPAWMTDLHHRADYVRAHRLHLVLEAASEAAERSKKAEAAREMPRRHRAAPTPVPGAPR